MKRALLLVSAIMVVALIGCDKFSRPLKTKEDKVSYGIGVEVAKNFQIQHITVDKKLVAKGMDDALSGRKLLLGDEELKATMQNFQSELRRDNAKRSRMSALDNRKAGMEFMEQNKAKEGVVTLPSGLQYKILKAGDGKKPTETDTVLCNYRGTLIDGTQFDASYQTGQAVAFEIRSVIPGWKEALQLMPVGSKWQLFIPPELAYGQRGSGMIIGPESTLVFELELVGIK